MATADYLKYLPGSIERFLMALSSSDCVGRYLPARQGLTPQGRQVALGFSCFAMKLAYMTGSWDRLPDAEKKASVGFIQSFQTDSAPVELKMGFGVFVDPEVDRCLAGKAKFWQRLMSNAPKARPVEYRRLVVMAETKQALATLAELGMGPSRACVHFPQSEPEVEEHLSSLDWSKPWGAGAHFAILCFLLRNQAPLFLPEEKVGALLSYAQRFIDGKFDVSTGAYYDRQADTPDHGNLINGAMKVLTGLDWLEMPIHSPERLIDTCLGELPKSDGCHLVDAVYVLYRCALQTEHRRLEVEQYLEKVLEMIASHYVEEDGGFSYHVGRSQTSYYGVPISRGLPCADLHGTLLLCWALAMIDRVSGKLNLNWNVIKP